MSSREIENRKAWHDYTILESFEAGIALTGPEIKSIRAGQANLKDSYAMIKGEELYLLNCHISPYEQGSFSNSEPTRTRKLLVKKIEVKRFQGRLQEKGLTLIPLKIYFKKRWAKLQLGLAKPKKNFDKRESIKKREQDRELRRAMGK